MRLADVPTPELLEVQLVNAIAPFILCAQLKPLMMRNPTGAKHVVNVSAMEGKFNRHTKTDKHTDVRAHTRANSRTNDCPNRSANICPDI